MNGRALPCISIAVALAAVLPSCGAGSPVARGFGSRQVLAIRDPSFNFTEGGAKAIVYSTAGDAGAIYWSLDLATGGVQVQNPTDGGAGAGIACTCELAIDAGASTGTLTFSETDAGTGPQESIDDVSAVVQCPCGSVTTASILRPDATGGLGIFSIDPTTLAATELVPATLGTAAWANGAASMGSLASGSLLLTEEHVTPIDGHFTYERTMNDGSTIMFAGAFSSGPVSELALFEIAASSTLIGFPAIYTVQGARLDVLAWELQDGAAQQASLSVWDDGSRQLVSCPLPAPIAEVGTASADGTQILFGATTPWDPSEPGGPSGPLVLVSLASGSCMLLASANTTNAGFSSDGSKMFWLTGGETLRIAAGDGSGARTAVSGGIYQPRFAEGTELEFTVGQELVWVDANDGSNTLHPIAEQAFGPFYDIDPTNTYGEGSWLVARYDFNTQDSTGTLGVVNRDTDTGARRPISTDVAQYLVSSNGPTDGGAPEVQVVYLVRGRNPSPQDGVWVATINQTELR